MAVNDWAFSGFAPTVNVDTSMDGLANSPEDFQSSRNADGSGYDIIRGYTADDGPAGGAFGTRINLYGPRLKNLNVAFSLYGIPIPISFGVRRLTGNTLWSSPLVERRDKDKDYINQTGGGSGFAPGFQLPGLAAMGLPSSTIKLVTYNYYYFADFATSFGYGDPNMANKRVARIWANGKIVYDMGNANAVDPKFRLSPLRYFPDLRFTFYEGTETQEPDPLIMAYENPRYQERNSLVSEVNVVPAYRGQMYIVFEKFPLGQFGNQIPNIQVEITDTVELVDFDEEYTGITAGTPGNSRGMGVDWRAHTLFSVYDGTLHHVDLGLNAVNFAVPIDQAYENFAFSPYTGKAWVSSVIDDGASIFSLDPFSINGIESSGTGAIDLTLGPYKIDLDNILKLVPCAFINDEGFVEDGVFILEGTGGTNIFLAPDPLPIVEIGTTETCFVPGPVTDQFPTAFWSSDDNTIKMFGPGVAPDGSVAGGFSDFYTTSSDIKGMIFHPGYNLLIVAENPSVGNGRVVGITPDGEVLWTLNLPGDGFSDMRGFQNYFWASDTSSNQLMIHRIGGIVVVDVRNGRLIKNRSLLGVDIDFTVTSADYQATFDLKQPHYYDKPYYERTDLKAFIEFAARLAGLTVDIDIEVDENISDIVIDGAYIIEVNLSFRDLLDNLRVAFILDVIESDGVLKVLKRDELSEADDFSYSGDDFLLPNISSQNSPAVTINRTSDDQIPNLIYYKFLDFNLSYEENTAIAQRSNFPDPTSESNRQMQIATPIIMRLSEAKGWAIKVLYHSWAARNAYSWILAPQEYALEPADCGIITTDGISYAVKIERVFYNADYSMSVNATSFQVDYPISIEADEPLRDDANLVPEAISFPYGLDMPDPFVVNQDLQMSEGVNAMLFMFAGPATLGRWRGGDIGYQAQGGNFIRLGPSHVNRSPKVGVSVGAFNAPNIDTTWETDTVNTLTVRFNDPTFEPQSATYENWLKGYFNTMLVGNDLGPDPNNDLNENNLISTIELVCARDVVDNLDGTYTFSNFMRGRKSTDDRMDHPDPCRVILMPPKSMYEAYLPVEMYDKSITVAAGNYGGLELLPPRTTKIKFRGLSAQPFSPVHARMYVDGTDLVLTWVRRSRAPEFWPDDGDEAPFPPLWEESEEYGVAFYFDDTYNPNAVPPFGRLGEIAFVEDTTELVMDAAARTLYTGTSTILESYYVQIVMRSTKWGDGVSRKVQVYVE